MHSHLSAKLKQDIKLKLYGRSIQKLYPVYIRSIQKLYLVSVGELLVASQS